MGLSRQSIQVVFFDAGNTLFRERIPRAAIYREVAGRHGIEAPEEAFREALERAHQRLPCLLDGAFRYSPAWFEHYIEQVFRGLDVHQVPASLRRQLFERFADRSAYQLFEDVLPALAALTQQGLRRGVISNWAPHLDSILEQLGILPEFEVVVVSSRIGIEKPEPAIFQRAIECAQVAPSRAIHVGDHEEKDVQGARRAGLHSVLLDRESHPTRSDAISSLRDLPELIQSIS